MTTEATGNSSNRFADAIAVVIGAASGIGSATARRLASEGAVPVLLDVDELAAEKVAAELPRAVVYKVDVTDSARVDAVIALVVERFGRIDLAAHVAGVDPEMAIKRRIGAHLERQSQGSALGFEGIVEITDTEWHRLLKINLDGTFFTNRAIGRVMIRQRSGAIVNVGSVQGLRGTIGTGHYNASKAGVRLLSQSLALELIGFGIRVNCVAPGPVETPMLDRSRAAGILGENGGEGLAAALPMKRVAEPSEVASVIAFLLSDDASYIVGETVNVNGGLALI